MSNAFPETRPSALDALRRGDPATRERALAAIAAAYWRPLYTYVRLRWRRSPEDAQDLTQELFARLLEKDFLAGYDPERARLRTFLRLCADRLVQNHDRDRGREKRGGESAGKDGDVLFHDLSLVRGFWRLTPVILLKIAHTVIA